ncbi:MAG: sulfatase-like hydrolase/transferase [Verrucomicrobia bacterium]|nr:sulfatase-like hydrolase/transferase [Verrucomicrobiota bacterium]MCH8526965.1 sulfatase-like hydrolase/transferase [Kiritimatiellia bacterium]
MFPASIPKKPNVIEIISDQHHAMLMGCAGHSQAVTPHLDTLAAAGVRFSNAHTQNPICTPSRVSILSGQYCHNHGYYGLSGPRPPQLPHFLGHFRSHGYRTAAIGKLHLPSDGGNWLSGQIDRLADTYETAAGEHGASEFLSGLEAAGTRDLEDSWHNPNHYGNRSIPFDARPSDLPYEQTQERWCLKEALRFIDGQPPTTAQNGADNRPFCIQIAFQRPHHPLLPQKQFWERYPDDIALPATFDQDPSHRPPHFRRMWGVTRRTKWDFASPGEPWIEGARRAWRGTLACVTQIDDCVGRLMEGLRNRGLLENTVIVYHSDHGCYHGIHGIVEKAPGICSDAVCRVPMIWRLPGEHPAGAVRDALVENIDIGPTLAALCGLPEMDWVDGRDLSPLLADGRATIRELAVTENPWSKAMRWGKWRFVHYNPRIFDGEDHGELYDLEADPEETRNLYHDAAHRAQVENCRTRLLNWLLDTTRTVTVMPPVTARENGRSYSNAGDGREPNHHGPLARQKLGNLNYL